MPSGFTVFSVVENEVLKNDPVDRWGSPDFVAWMDKYNGASIPPPMVSKLKVMKLFKERTLKRP